MEEKEFKCSVKLSETRRKTVLKKIMARKKKEKKSNFGSI
jgi:hypothetical protein